MVDIREKILMNLSMSPVEYFGFLDEAENKRDSGMPLRQVEESVMRFKDKNEDEVYLLREEIFAC